MNKKLKRLLWPEMWVFFTVLIGFAVAALVLRYYILAAAEGALAAGLLAYYLLSRKRRHAQIQQFAKTTFGVHESVGGTDTPFPMALVRLGDGCVIWANDPFCGITGFQQKYLEQSLDSVMPGFSTEWLVSGKLEYPYDVTLSGRRYRVYGSAVRCDDPDNTLLGMLYFADLTELYQVLDEYIRSRPVVSIILVDNYEELT